MSFDAPVRTNGRMRAPVLMRRFTRS